eukprot:2508302-Pleurochrysis_carterae.AAC.1
MNVYSAAHPRPYCWTLQGSRSRIGYVRQQSTVHMTYCRFLPPRKHKNEEKTRKPQLACDGLSIFCLRVSSLIEFLMITLLYESNVGNRAIFLVLKSLQPPFCPQLARLSSLAIAERAGHPLRPASERGSRDARQGNRPEAGLATAAAESAPTRSVP